MSIVKRNQFYPAFNSLFDDFFTKDVWNWGLNNNSATNTSIPAVNICETQDHFDVEMAAPGMRKEDFKIELDGPMLTISSERKNETTENEEGRYSRKEFSYQSFRRTFQLPRETVDADNIEARYENGVLQLRIPKREEAKQKPPRSIQIK